MKKERTHPFAETDACRVYPGDMVMCSYSKSIQLVVSRVNVSDNQHCSCEFEFRLLGGQFTPEVGHHMMLLCVIT